MKNKTVVVNKIKISNDLPMVFIAGPCVIESEKQCLVIAEKLVKITDKLHVPFIFKTSYDKANRTSGKSYRGTGLRQGIKILSKIKQSLGVSLITDVHSVGEIESVAEVVDIIQIPAFLCRQTDLVLAAAKTGKIVNIKKGQFLAPWDMKNVIQKIESAGSNKILLTERGTSFGYNNLVVDFRSLIIMKQTGYPVIFDATHSVQLPGGQGTATGTGGQREFVPDLSRAAMALGVAGLFWEVHPDPDHALSDGSNMIPLSKVQELVESIKNIDKLVKSGGRLCQP